MKIEKVARQDQVIWAWFPVTFLTAFFCCVLWGSASPAIKIAYSLFRIGPEDTASRIMLAGARFMIAGVMTIGFGLQNTKNQRSISNMKRIVLFL